LWTSFSAIDPAPAIDTPTSTPAPTLAAPAKVRPVMVEVALASIMTLPASLIVLS
jgi:hypothetical protein